MPLDEQIARKMEQVEAAILDLRERIGTSSYFIARGIEDKVYGSVAYEVRNIRNYSLEMEELARELNRLSCL